MTFKDLLSKVVEGKSLTRDEAVWIFEGMLKKTLSPEEVAGILVALRMKGETVEEIASAVSVLRREGRKVPLSEDLRNSIVDTCGTGGDLKGTFNVSTAVALVTASCGVPVAKHGNRSVSSRCGSADVLEALGVRIDLEPEEVARCIEETGFGFMFAPKFHPAMASVAGVRRKLGIRTIFNIVGPLANPASAKRQLVGVFSRELVEKIADVLVLLGAERAFVVHGLDGMDEITLCDETEIAEVRNGKKRFFRIKPEEFGFKRADPEELKGGDLEENKRILLRILEGRERGPRRDIVVLNSAFALLLGGKVSSVEEGILLADSAISEGKPYALLEKVVSFTRGL